MARFGSAPTLRTFAQARDDFPLVAGMKLAAEEAHDVVSREGAQSMVVEAGEHVLEGRAIAKHDVGSDLGLVDAPVVAAEASRRDLRQQWVDPPCQSVQDGCETAVSQGLGEALCGQGGRRWTESSSRSGRSRSGDGPERASAPRGR